MKNTYTRNKSVLAVVLSAMLIAAVGCAEKEDTKAATTTAAPTTISEVAKEDTEKTEEVATEVSEEESSEASEVENETKSTDAEELAQKQLFDEVQKYIDSSFAYVTKQSDCKGSMDGESSYVYEELVVYLAEIEVTDEGYTFALRTRGREQANVLYSNIRVNTATGELSDDYGNVWSVNG